MLELYAVKVARTVLRRGLHLEMEFLSDYVAPNGDLRKFGIKILES